MGERKVKGFMDEKRNKLLNSNEIVLSHLWIKGGYCIEIKNLYYKYVNNFRYSCSIICP